MLQKTKNVNREFSALFVPLIGPGNPACHAEIGLCVAGKSLTLAAAGRSLNIACSLSQAGWQS